jgi:NAD(P)-dependent dehydrogenase (short-subunit alcohol dehydrogenase family)
MAATKRRYLHAIVNNAGMGRIGYIDWLKLSDFEDCFAVNCLGQIRMSKAFLPIFKRQATEFKQKPNNASLFYAPKIVNMVSMAGTSRGGLALSPYEVSKAAAEAFTDALRLEVKPWGIHVVSINPSFHTTPLTTNVYDRLHKDLWTPLSPDLKQEYGEGKRVVKIAFLHRNSVRLSTFSSLGA